MDGVETPRFDFRVGLAHGSIPFRSDIDDTSNSILKDRSDSARLDYLALGDSYRTREINSRTWHSGTPEKDRFDDIDSGNVLLVTLESQEQSAQKKNFSKPVFLAKVGARSWS